MVDKVPNTQSSPEKGLVNGIYNSGKTPFPAALASASLLFNLPAAAKNSLYKPSRISIFGFGAAFALGGFIVYDGDTVNGAGFTSAWSILYMMVNGKAAIKQMKPLSLGVAGLVTFNAVNYGREFFFPSSGQTFTY